MKRRDKTIIGFFVLALAACGGQAATTPAASGSAGPTASEAAAQPAATPTLEVVAEVDQGPGNITVTPAGQVVMSLHQFYDHEWRVVSLGKDGQLSAAAVASNVNSVLGLQADKNGVVWLLDNAMRGGSKRRLVGWNMSESRAVADVDLTAASPDDAFLNDLAVDTDNGAVYIADPAGGANAALIVVDIASGTARRVLEGHESVVPMDMDLIIDGTPVRIRTPDGNEIRPRVGVNPIAADSANEWLYFGPMHGTSMYRVRTADLRDSALSAEQLASRVERYSDKPICDGISMDEAGNIYISDIGNNAIGVIGPDRSYRVLIADPRLSWPDAFSFGPDGYLYTVANQLHRSAVLNGGTAATVPPFLVLRLRPLAGGVVGR